MSVFFSLVPVLFQYVVLFILLLVDPCVLDLCFQAHSWLATNLWIQRTREGCHPYDYYICSPFSSPVIFIFIHHNVSKKT